MHKVVNLMIILQVNLL